MSALWNRLMQHQKPWFHWVSAVFCNLPFVQHATGSQTLLGQFQYSFYSVIWRLASAARWFPRVCRLFFELREIIIYFIPWSLGAYEDVWLWLYAWISFNGTTISRSWHSGNAVGNADKRIRLLGGGVLSNPAQQTVPTGSKSTPGIIWFASRTIFLKHKT